MSFDWLNPEAKRSLLLYWEDRFGVGPKSFEGLDFFRKGDFVHAVSDELREAADTLGGADAGVQIVKYTRSGLFKPVTSGVQRFGAAATTNVVELDEEGLRSLVEGRKLEAEGLQGFVILKMRGVALGVGLCREGRLEGQLPRAMTQHLVMQKQVELV